MQVQKRVGSKVLDREYVEMVIDAGAGKITRKDAIEAAAKELGVPAENVGLVRLEEQSGTMKVLGKFQVYGSKASKERVHPSYLEERSLSKEDRERLKQERKKAKTAAPAPEAKK